MHVITVTFRIEPEHIAPFNDAMRAQARNSLDNEVDCHRFDVCHDPEDPTIVYLYEIYTDLAAFKHHLKTEHFKAFDQTVADWLISKDVKAWTLDYSAD